MKVEIYDFEHFLNLCIAGDSEWRLKGLECPKSNLVSFNSLTCLQNLLRSADQYFMLSKDKINTSYKYTPLKVF